MTVTWSETATDAITDSDAGVRNCSGGDTNDSDTNGSDTGGRYLVTDDTDAVTDSSSGGGGAQTTATARKSSRIYGKCISYDSKRN